MAILKDILGNMSVNKKLMAGFALVLLLTAGLGITAYSQVTTMNNAVVVLEHAEEVNTLIGEVRQKDKNFQIREDQASINSNAEMIAEIKHNLAAILPLATGEEKAIIAEAEASIVAYEGAFAELVKETREMRELQAKCSTDAHVIEDYINGADYLDDAASATLMVDLLMIRRAEKDYMLRGGEKYADKMASAVSTLEADIDTSALTASDKSAIKAGVAAYHATFLECVAVTDGLVEHVSTSGPLATDGMAVKARAEELAEDTITRVDAAAASAKTVVVAFVIIAIILGILIATVISKSITNPLNEVMTGANRIKDGDFGYDINVDSNDELGDLARTFGEMKGNLQAMVDDTDMLAQAGVEGRLDVRADASKHGGDFRKIVEGVNELIDAVAAPLNVAAEYVDRISKGDIPEKITDEYKGDFNEIKNNLNILIDAENEATMIAHEIGQGNLAVKAEKRSEQDELMESMADMIDAVNMLVTDTGMLAQAAVDGKLDVRADASKHGGDFGKIVEEMNGMLDGVNRPLKVVMEYIDRISRGDMPERSTGKARGVFLEIQSSMNQCIDAINAMVDDINTLAQAGIEGRLKVRADASKHGGDFGKIVGGANDLLGAVSSPVRDCARVLKSVADGDLTQKTEVDAQGYLRALLDDTDACVDSMTDIIVGSKKTASKVLGTAEGLAGAAEEMNAGMEQLASASQEVAEGSQKLSELAQVAAHGVESMSAQIEQTSANASRSREKTDDAVRISSEVQEAAKNTLEGLASIQEGIARTSDTVGEMNTAIEKVGDMGDVITDVADQTNMLGLNAAIEAARAGEAGRGFAVVADAVKNLAEKVKDAASESAVAVQHIQGSGENAINATGTAVDESAKGGELLHTALEGVDRTVAAMGEVSTMVAEIDSSTKQLSEVAGKVVATIDEVASVSEESASASEESSSAVEEQTSAIEELTAETQGLSDIANQLMDELNRFKIEESEAEGGMR